MAHHAAAYGGEAPARRRAGGERRLRVYCVGNNLFVADGNIRGFPLHQQRIPIHNFYPHTEAKAVYGCGAGLHSGGTHEIGSRSAQLIAPDGAPSNGTTAESLRC